MSRAEDLVTRSLDKVLQIIVGDRCVGSGGDRDSSFSIETTRTPELSNSLFELLSEDPSREMFLDLWVHGQDSYDDDERLLLERWHLHHEPRTKNPRFRRSRLAQRLLVLVRVLISTIRLLPGFRSVSGLHWTLEGSSAHAMVFDVPAKSFEFTPVDSESGKLHLSVFYRPEIPARARMMDRPKLVARHATRTSRPIPIASPSLGSGPEVPFASSYSSREREQNSLQSMATPPLITNSASLRWTPPSFGNPGEGRAVVPDSGISAYRMKTNQMQCGSLEESLPFIAKQPSDEPKDVAELLYRIEAASNIDIGKNESHNLKQTIDQIEDLQEWYRRRD